MPVTTHDVCLVALVQMPAFGRMQWADPAHADHAEAQACLHYALLRQLCGQLKLHHSVITPEGVGAWAGFE
jgi:hypothetical protein